MLGGVGRCWKVLGGEVLVDEVLGSVGRCWKVRCWKVKCWEVKCW